MLCVSFGKLIKQVRLRERVREKRTKKITCVVFLFSFPALAFCFPFYFLSYLFLEKLLISSNS